MKAEEKERYKMSRSNPNEMIPHPCERWYEWNGAKGNLRYYDRENKVQIEVDIPFGFILLDQVAAIRGWSDKFESGIYSNEVKDTRSEPLTVKYFKGGEFAKGLYAEIKDTVLAAGGHFVLNCYVAFGDTGNRDIGVGSLRLGSIQFKGAALSAWMEFEKKNRKDAWKKRIRITGYKEGKKGSITFRTPEFEIEEISKEDDEEATLLDRGLQTYLKSYFKRDVVEPAQPEPEREEPSPDDDNMPF